MRADVDGVARVPVVIWVGSIVEAVTVVLHVGCIGRRGYGLAKLERLRMLGEEGPHGSVSITRQV